MSQSVDATVPDPSSLPDEDYTLVHISKLVHGEHNPRRVQPKRTLKQSIEGSGINRPLIVRPDPEEDVYHITDGWQRYQAAIDAGWEQLPVKICETTLEALDQTKLDSAGRREWSPYDWAQFCRSMAQEIRCEDDSKMDIARRVADAVDLTPNTVRRYLNVLSLPDVIHPLLTVGPDGSETEWSHLQGYNEDVRQYRGLRLQVADRLATLQSSVSSDERLIAIATTAVEFTEPEDEIEFINLAAENDQQRLDIIQREVRVGSDHNQYLIVPRVAVELTTEQKQALMEYCHEQRQSLSALVTEEITAFATDILEGDTDDEIESSVGTGDDEQIEC